VHCAVINLDIQRVGVIVIPGNHQMRRIEPMVLVF
jgi:hypothetical protein